MMWLYSGAVYLALSLFSEVGCIHEVSELLSALPLCPVRVLCCKSTCTRTGNVVSTFVTRFVVLAFYAGYKLLPQVTSTAFLETSV